MSVDRLPVALLPLLGLVVGVLLLRALFSAIGKPGVARVVARPLLTQAELRFLQVLIEALPGRVISCQVSMGALLRPEEGLDRKQWWSTYGRFSQKIVDFVVIDPDGGGVAAVVELDDRSHDAGKDAARDAMLLRAGYRVVRFGNRPWPTIETVREQLSIDGEATPIAPTQRRRRVAP